jgi:hypothetical protein
LASGDAKLALARASISSAAEMVPMDESRRRSWRKIRQLLEDSQIANTLDLTKCIIAARGGEVVLVITVLDCASD